MLFGLTSHEKAVNLVWDINRYAPFDFKRTDDFEIKRGSHTYHFIQYEFTNIAYEQTFILLKNQCDGALILPELKNVNYFIQINYAEEKPSSEILSFLNKPSAGQLCFEINPSQLKPISKELFRL